MPGKKTNETKEEKPKDGSVFRITAKAAVIGPDGRVLVLTRAQDDRRGPGKRDLPGGHVDAGEHPGETIIREVKEETGLAVRDVTPLPFFRHFVGDEGDALQALRFVAFADGVEVKTDPAEHDDFAWMTLDEAAENFEDKGYEADKRRTVLLAKEHLENRDAIGGWKRCLADFENYRKRRDAEGAEMGAYRVEGLLADLIPVLDNFHAAAEHVPEEAKNSPWVTGIGYIAKQFEDTLADHGVTMIEPKEGDAFDPALHEAMSSKDEEETTHENSGELKIAKVLRKGFQIGDKVVRAAQVAVE